MDLDKLKSNVTDRELSEFVRELPLRADHKHHRERYAMALVITQIDDRNNREEKKEIFFLANEDKEWYAGIDE